MKKLLLALAISPMAFGGAKLSIKPQYHLEKKKMGATAGISIYQRLVDGIALNAWSGFGYRPGYGTDDGVKWAAVQAGIDFQCGKWIFTPEMQFRYSPTFLDRDNSANFKITRQLW